MNTATTLRAHQLKTGAAIVLPIDAPTRCEWDGSCDEWAGWVIDSDDDLHAVCLVCLDSALDWFLHTVPSMT